MRIANIVSWCLLVIATLLFADDAGNADGLPSGKPIRLLVTLESYQPAEADTNKLAA